MSPHTHTFPLCDLHSGWSINMRESLSSFVMQEQNILSLIHHYAILKSSYLPNGGIPEGKLKRLFMLATYCFYWSFACQETSQGYKLFTCLSHPSISDLTGTYEVRYISLSLYLHYTTIEIGYSKTGLTIESQIPSRVGLKIPGYLRTESGMDRVRRAGSDAIQV